MREREDKNEGRRENQHVVGGGMQRKKEKGERDLNYVKRNKNR
jgi:hypothetical protein